MNGDFLYYGPVRPCQELGIA